MSRATGAPRRSGRRWAVAALAGLGGMLVGSVAGLIAGANIGGNWLTWVDLGDLHGYEATGVVGAAVGAIALGALALWLALRRW